MAVAINLLPWREIAREKIKIDFLRNVYICALLSLVSCTVAFYALDHRLSEQEARNSYLTEHIILLDNKINQIENISIQHEQLDLRIEVIQSLQGHRPMIVHVFEQLVQTLPEGVYYKSLTRQDKRLTISGMASANGQVSDLMRKLDASLWLKNSELISIVENDQDQALKDFVLKVDIHRVRLQMNQLDA